SRACDKIIRRELGTKTRQSVATSPTQRFEEAMMHTSTSLRMLMGFVVALWSQYALATFHEWKIDQVYSNADGSVQYVDFVLAAPSDDERFLFGRTLTAGLNSHSLTFGSDLPSEPVAGQHFLVATPGFAAIAGVLP